jgi:hypothetical protein
LQTAEKRNKSRKEMLAKASYNKDFGEMKIELRREFLQKLDDRDLS